jgi:2-dehydro-3-deoxyglucarate aldolase
VLDAGADGIIVPMVNNREAAVRAVSYAKYPPHGVRGVGLNRAQNYGYGFADYWDWVKEGLVIVVQIEHHEGVKNIDEILSVDGVDGVFVGPYDLSCSLEVPGVFDSEEMKRALKTIELATLKAKKSLGYHVIEPDISLVSDYLSKGYNFIAFSTDFLLMGRKATEEMKKLSCVNP